MNGENTFVDKIKKRVGPLPKKKMVQWDGQK